MSSAARIDEQEWALVVDDHPLFSDALVLTLKSATRFDTIRTASSLKAALETIEAHGAPKIVVLDLNLPDVRGLDGLIRIRDAAEDVPVIIVSSLDENRIIQGALEAGASGFVPKHSSRQVLRDAMAAIEAGESYLPEGFVAPVHESELSDAARRIASLTNQQARILDLICEGKLNKQIAYELSIAEATVKAHMTAIMRKLGVQSRTQAVLVTQQAQLENSLPTND